MRKPRLVSLWPSSICDHNGHRAKYGLISDVKCPKVSIPWLIGEKSSKRYSRPPLYIWSKNVQRFSFEFGMDKNLILCVCVPLSREIVRMWQNWEIAVRIKQDQLNMYLIFKVVGMNVCIYQETVIYETYWCSLFLFSRQIPNQSIHPQLQSQQQQWNL